MGLTLSRREIEQFQQLILRRTGIVIEEARHEVLRFSLEQRLAGTGCGSAAAYYQFLQEQGDREFQELIQLLTVGETFFFRTEQHWQALKQEVLPELIAWRRQEAEEQAGREGSGQPSPSLRLWSAGCASGEEPYSLAILLHELIPDLARWTITLLGSDINEHALATAIRGRYGRRSVESATDPAYRERHFALKKDTYELDKRVREIVEFRALNLVRDSYPSLLSNTCDMDLILCRNVTIYFTPELAREVQNKLYRSLSPGGLLLIGHAETIIDRLLGFTVVHKGGITFYQRPAAGLVLPPLQEPIKVPLDRRSQVLTDGLPLPPPEQRGQEHLQRGLEYLRGGLVDRARQELEEALQALPRSPKVHCALGEVYASTDLEEMALEQWQQAIDLDSLYPLPYFFLGLLYKSRGDRSRAEELLRKAIYLDPQMVLARFHLAQLYHAGGQSQYAIREYRNTRRYLRDMPAQQFVEHSEGFTIGLVQRLCDKAISELNGSK